MSREDGAVALLRARHGAEPDSVPPEVEPGLAAILERLSVPERFGFCAWLRLRCASLD